MLWTIDKHYANDPFEKESQLEAAVIEVSKELFGPNRIYLDLKKRIGTKGKTKNIPDGYLIDLTSKTRPRLYVVENELAIHEPLRHVAVQILEFSLSFETSSIALKTILKDKLKADKLALQLCEKYAVANGFENIDYLLERMTQTGNAFNALVIIDDLDEELEKVLVSRFRFPVEIVTLRRFKAKSGQGAYEFEPFLADLAESTDPDASASRNVTGQIDPSALDTIVVPAWEEGFKETFLGEDRWYAIRIHSSMLSNIKYIAAYQVTPVSAITHVAPVADIRPWKNTGKYVVNFAKPAKKIRQLKLIPKKGRVKALRGPRYTTYERLMKATNLDEAF